MSIKGVKRVYRYSSSNHLVFDALRNSVEIRIVSPFATLFRFAKVVTNGEKLA